MANTPPIYTPPSDPRSLRYIVEITADEAMNSDALFDGIYNAVCQETQKQLGGFRASMSKHITIALTEDHP